MNKTQPFDLAKAIPAAWKLQWKQKQEWAADPKMMRYRSSMTQYLTARDIENQVRAFAEEQAQGKAWGSSGASWCNVQGVRIRLGGRMRLLDVVRRWLQREESAGRLASHNFGRGHISGARYRPANLPISDTEKKTMKRKEARRGQVRVVHFYSAAREHGRAMLCRPPKPGYHRFSRNTPRCSKEKSEVTCPRCLKLLSAAGKSKLSEHLDIVEQGGTA